MGTRLFHLAEPVVDNLLITLCSRLGLPSTSLRKPSAGQVFEPPGFARSG